jgi:predicted NACHT family NTPase
MQLSPHGKQLLEYALTERAWTLQKLAEESALGISTVKTFSAGKRVHRNTFVKFCQTLGIDWETACEQANTLTADVGDRPSLSPQPQDDLIQQVREPCRQKILEQHSRMRLLSGEEIGVDQLYVDVWLLNRSPRTYQVSPSKLLETFDLRHDRLGLGDRIQSRPGFEVANENSKLVILGKPGSGKTTFLKHLAVDWCKGEFQPDLIAVLIEFRRVRDGQWYLLDAIGKVLGLDQGHQIRALKEKINELRDDRETSLNIPAKQRQIEVLQQQLNTLSLQILLQAGKPLILMDGLDEVPTSDLRHKVQDQLRELAEEYPQNRLVLTCRTQILTSIPAGFTSVEVADFNPEQVQQFVHNWFVANGKSRAVATQQWKMLSKAASLPKDSNALWHWWPTNGPQWIEQLRQVMIQHRNIGHDWQFTAAERQQLRRYYDANKFLVDLMKIKGAVSDSVRADIEDTLLLPWDELQRRQPGFYGRFEV